MYNFYNIYAKLCAEANIGTTEAAIAIGLSNAAASGWKNGKKPSAVNIQKLSIYFTEKLGRSITVSYLKGEEPEQPIAREPTSLSDIQRMNDDELLEYAKSEELALYGGEEEDSVDRTVLELAAEHKLRKHLVAQQKKPVSKKADGLTKEDIKEWIKTAATEEELIQFIADASARLVKK